MPPRKTTSDFIEEATLIHGGLYSYKDTVYTKRSEKLTIGCRAHGNFEQTAGNHLSGSGCPDCKKEKARQRLLSNTEEFITRSKDCFGNKFDYSDAKYEDASTPLTLRCAEHGEIRVSPHFHLTSKFGCPKCGIEYRGFIQRNKTEEFISEAESVHGKNYDYTNTRYETAKLKVKILCKKHGEFETIPYHHLTMKSGGCSQCKQDGFPLRNLRDTEYFIERAILVHGSKYDYTKSNYIKAAEPVEITCPEHGTFLQTPNAHTSGKGCQECGKIRTSVLSAPWWDSETYSLRFERTHLYLIRIWSKETSEEFYKIGISIRPTRRFSEISNNSRGKYHVEPILIVEGESSQILGSEKELLSSLLHLKHTPEFDFCGKSECFHITQEVLRLFYNHVNSKYIKVSSEEQKYDRIPKTNTKDSTSTRDSCTGSR